MRAEGNIFSFGLVVGVREGAVMSQRGVAGRGSGKP